MNLLTIVPGYNSRYDTERFIVDIRRLVEHDQVVVPLLRGKDAFAMVNEPVEFRARRDDLAESSIQHYNSYSYMNVRPRDSSKRKRTGLSSVPARDLRACLLVIDKPLLQAAHDTPAVMERGFGPLLLRLVRIRDLLRDLGRGVGKNGIKVVCSRGVVSSDVFPALEGYRGEKAVGVQMRFEPGLGQLLRCPCVFDLLTRQRHAHVSDASDYRCAQEEHIREEAGYGKRWRD